MFSHGIIQRALNALSRYGHVVYGNAQGMYTQGIVVMLLHTHVTLTLIYRVHYPYHGSCLSKCALLTL